MKITTKDAVYVQRKDIAFLNSTDIAIPFTIYSKTFYDDINIIDDSNKYEFVKFDGEHEIKFIKNMDWMIDYSELKDKSEEELIELGRSITEEKNKIAIVYNAMTYEEKIKNQDMVNKCDLLEFKMYSLRDFIWFKQGRLNIELPSDIDYPKGYVKKKTLK